MGRRLSTFELHHVLIESLGDHVVSHSDLNTKPLYVEIKAPYNWKLKIYIYNCTNPPGARQAGEYKSQIILPGQKRGERGSFKIEPDTLTLLMGFASVTGTIADGIFIIWELAKHMEFAYSANIQVSLETLLRAYQEPMFAMKKRGNGEWIVVSRSRYLLEGIKNRFDVDVDLLLEG